MHDLAYSGYIVRNVKYFEFKIRNTNGLCILTRNNIIWKRLLLMLLQDFFASARLHRVHKKFCY